jgi:hypothetical protein
MYQPAPKVRYTGPGAFVWVYALKVSVCTSGLGEEEEYT